MNVFMWILALTFGLLFLGAFVVGWRIFFHNYIKRDSFTSVIPFVGGMAGCVAVLCIPIDDLKWMWWIPFIIDWGSFPIILFAVFHHLIVSRRA